MFFWCLSKSWCATMFPVSICFCKAGYIDFTTADFITSMYLKTHLFPKLITPLACSHLSTNQYKYIQQQYITSAISYMGYNTCPVSLKHGDHKYCGLQLKHLEIEALIRKISHLRLLLFKTHTSQLVLAILAWYQHVSVISFPVLEQYPFNLDYINSLWSNDFVRLIKNTK